jgi:hypothetical protein
LCADLSGEHIGGPFIRQLQKNIIKINTKNIVFCAILVMILWSKSGIRMINQLINTNASAEARLKHGKTQVGYRNMTRMDGFSGIVNFLAAGFARMTNAKSNGG